MPVTRSNREVAEQAPVLPDTSGWVKREPGDVIEAGTPFIHGNSAAIHAYPEGRPARIDVTYVVTYWTPPPPARTPVDDIPVGALGPVLAAWVTFGREGAPPARYLGEWWMTEESELRRVGDTTPWAAQNVTSVEPLHVIPAELAEEIKAWAVGENVGGATKLVDAVAEALR